MRLSQKKNNQTNQKKIITFGLLSRIRKKRIHLDILSRKTRLEKQTKKQFNLNVGKQRSRLLLFEINILYQQYAETKG